MKHMTSIAALLLVSSFALAQEGIDKRQENQEKRIDNGIKSGELTKGETKHLENEQNRIERMEDRAEADGKVTRKERKRLERAQNHASRDIYREKHNGRHK